MSAAADAVRRGGAPPVRVALFCGGRGSATIIREFLRWPNVELTLLVNAYDDGLSTGALRDFIAGMLGPSDFRKNLSYLLDTYSDDQYALRNVLEYRLPKTVGATEAAAFERFTASGDATALEAGLRAIWDGLAPATRRRLLSLLRVFVDYARAAPAPFDYRDCALGNLIFAGAYLQSGRNFNAAAQTVSRLVSSQATLVNVSGGENRTLVALKNDGTLLARESEIVGPQSAVPIRGFYFLDGPVEPAAWQRVAARKVADKEAWLAAREALPSLSAEAAAALDEADIIVYGPGTQHSSLLPSYRIAGAALADAPARVKAFVVNLGSDYDIQTLQGGDLVDRALAAAGCPHNDADGRRMITHILVDAEAGPDTLRMPETGPSGLYRRAAIVDGAFASGGEAPVHNGNAVVGAILALWDGAGEDDGRRTLDIFVDLYRRRAAIDSVVEEFNEIDWAAAFTRVRLRINGLGNIPVETNPAAVVESARFGGPFPEVAAFRDWLVAGEADYLVTLTGDGEYRFRDVMTGFRVLAGSAFGAIYGSRTQSRRQFRLSLRAAYGERGFAMRLSFLGAFLLSILFALRFGVIFSDPLTGFRIYRRRDLEGLRARLPERGLTPTSITRRLVAAGIEIAELPVHYRTFAGFVDPRWRLRRGLLNLLGLFR